MELFNLIDNIYTKKDCNWINDIQDNMIQPVIIQKFLSMNSNIIFQVRWLDKFVYRIPSKMYLALAWSVIPKLSTPPYVEYIKEDELEEKYKEVLYKIKKLTKMSDNDYKYNKKYLIYDIDKNPKMWFEKLGMNKKVYSKYGIEYKSSSNKKRNESIGPDLFSYV